MTKLRLNLINWWRGTVRDKFPTWFMWFIDDLLDPKGKTL